MKNKVLKLRNKVMEHVEKCIWKINCWKIILSKINWIDEIKIFFKFEKRVQNLKNKYNILMGIFECQLLSDPDSSTISLFLHLPLPTKKKIFFFLFSIMINESHNLFEKFLQYLNKNYWLYGKKI